MRRIMLTVAYDGTNYHGWQLQDNGDTIEEELIRAIERVTGVCGDAVTLIGGSRTDAGVHALCNVAVFDTESRIPGEKFSYALNAHLPEDIRVVKSEEVAADFHPRKMDTVKTYEYRIYNAEFPLPTKRLYSHFSYTVYDIEKMRQAAKYIEGEHDFTSFCTVGAQVDSKVRTVYSCEVITEGNVGKNAEENTEQKSRQNAGKKPGQDIIIRVAGNGFLYNMVRIIAGTLMEVGRGQIDANDIPAIIDAKDRSKAGPTAPACGLTLVKYEFASDSLAN